MTDAGKWRDAVAACFCMTSFLPQVMDILLSFMELREWGAACAKAVPPRKKDEGKEGDARGGKRQKLEGGEHVVVRSLCCCPRPSAAAVCDKTGAYL